MLLFYSIVRSLLLCSLGIRAVSSFRAESARSAKSSRSDSQSHGDLATRGYDVKLDAQRSRKEDSLQNVSSIIDTVGRSCAEGSSYPNKMLAGLAMAVLSAFFNGSFPAWSRLPAVSPDPIFFNWTVCMGACLSSLTVPFIVGVPFQFIIQGFIAGSFFFAAALLSFVAIPRCGLAIAQAVWSCSAILVSLAWGIIGPSQIASPLGSVGLTMLSVVLLLAGTVLIVSAESVAARVFGEAVNECVAGAIDSDVSADGETGSTRAFGIVSALSVGLFGGSILVPLKFIPPGLDAMVAVPSFGLGAGVTSTVATLLYFTLVAGPPKLDVGAPLVISAGLMSGLTWNIGNVCNIFAQRYPLCLPFGIAYPTFNCAVVFGGLWGIFVFREITGKSVWIFWSGCLVLIGGLTLLSAFGPQ